MIDAFSSLHGDPDGNKDDIINLVKWEFTGNVNTQYAAPDAIWPNSRANPGKNFAMSSGANPAPSSAPLSETNSAPSSAANSSYAPKCQSQTATILAKSVTVRSVAS